MKNRTLTLLFMLLAVIVTLLGMAAGIYFNSPQAETPITLPQKTEGENIDIEDIRRENVRVVETVTVDKNNVLGLVSQLKRPLEFHFATENTVFSGESSKVTASDCYVKGTKAKVVRSENGRETMHYVLTDNSLYLWESGKRSYEKLGKGSFSYDDVAFMPPYEDLLDFAVIDDAKSFDSEGNIFIEVTGKREDSEISETYVISVSTGLPTEVIFKNGNEILASTKVNLIGTDEIAEHIFLLPDNSTAS
ncbi:MAG: hypothetical protein IJO47_01520 [Clostridia bacterium]|nr:hypothetical protein [Clostridia bacterium]